MNLHDSDLCRLHSSTTMITPKLTSHQRIRVLLVRQHYTHDHAATSKLYTISSEYVTPFVVPVMVVGILDPETY